MSDSGAIVRVENIVKDFRPGFGVRRKRVLHGISFDVRQGEIFGFVGPNGAGKTTTLKVLMGLIRAPPGGSATILGSRRAVRQRSPQARGLPPGEPLLLRLPHRLAEILDFYARLSGCRAKARRVRTGGPRCWTGWVSPTLQDARLRTYSKGMLQRVGIAQALVHDPSVVFLDEPMSGLDPIGRKEIRDLILRLRGDGKTVFMNTHILPDVEMVCDRVAIIVKGRICHEGAIDRFLDDGEREADVVLTGLPPEIPVQLEEQFQAKLRGLGERIEIRVVEKHVQAVLGRALEVGAEVISVTPHRDSLESIFLHAVEEGSR